MYNYDYDGDLEEQKKYAIRRYHRQCNERRVKERTYEKRTDMLALTFLGAIILAFVFIAVSI